MKKFLRFGALGALLIGSASAWAGDCGFSCQNMCPLAKSANERRSFGMESPSKGALAAQVQKNLAKV